MKPIVAAGLLLSSTAAFADSPIVKHVVSRQVGESWNFDVTIQHGDTGWDDYANAWRIVDSQGQELGRRQLNHPHVDEQPFTRSLSGVRIPSDLTEVGVQASDSVGGWSRSVKMVKLR